MTVCGVAYIQEIGEQQRAEPVALHRTLQARQAFLGEPLHIDAEWGEIGMKH
jgi:hypothetical protein